MRLFLLIANVNILGRDFFNHYKSSCNICQRKPWFWLPRGHNSAVLKEFKVIGAGPRNVDCPICFSSDRDRLVYHYLENRFGKDSTSKKSVLHVAPEKPIWKRWKNWDVQATGIDKRTKGYKFSYHKSVLKADLTDLPFEDSRFDMIICNHVLEHIPDEYAAIMELHRVLRTGGSAILQVPFSPIRTQKRVNSKLFNRMQRINWVGQHDHVRLYANEPWKDWLSYGFEFIPFEIDRETRINYRMHLEEPLILLKKL